MSTAFPGSKSRPNPDRLIVGSVLIALGVLIFLQQAGYGGAGQIIGGWWPIVIIVAGAAHMASSRGVAGGPLLVVLIGLALLAGTLGIVSGGTLALIWPFILVWLGTTILLRRPGNAARVASDENNPTVSAAWSGITHVSRASRLRSARLSALCGGIVFDLRQASLDPDGATIDATANCGGIEIRVPTGWQVEMSGTPIFGGYDSKELEDEVLLPGAPRLRVDVAAICGGVVVKH